MMVAYVIIAINAMLRSLRQLWLGYYEVLAIHAMVVGYAAVTTRTIRNCYAA